VGHPDTSSAVQAVVDWFGPVDLLQMQAMERDDTPCDDPYDHDAGDSYESRWLCISLQYDVDTAELADPITWIPTAGVLPPFAIAHGDADCVVDIGQSRLLVAALDEAGDPPQVTTLTGGTHMDARFDREVLDPTIAWLEQVLGR
jgi:acetyl esterase/lipase